MVIFVFIIIIVTVISISRMFIEKNKSLFPFVIGLIICLIFVCPNLELIYKKRKELNNINRQDIKNITLYNVPNQDNKSLDSLEINDSNSIDSIFSFVKQSEEAFMWNPRAYYCTMILTINLINNNTLDFHILNTTDSGTMLLLIENSNKQERLWEFKNANSPEYINKLCEKMNTMPGSCQKLSPRSVAHRPKSALIIKHECE